MAVFQYGEIEEMNVCDNLGDHLVGNVYVKVRVCSCCSLIRVINIIFILFNLKEDVFLSFDKILWLLMLQFRYEEDAEKAVNELNNRWFNGRPVHAELSPVTDFREACCRQYEMG